MRNGKISENSANIGLTGDKISYIGDKRLRARKVIRGTGFVLAPGFIDVNSCGWPSEAAAVLKLQDGITTFLNAHGDSFKSDAKKFKSSERLNYATSVGLMPAYAQHMTRVQILAALEDSLRYGAYTISLSPEYSANTTPDLVRELSKYFAHKNVLFSFHLRYSSESEELAGIQEAIACAIQGNPVHILHITSTGATFHPKEASQIINIAVQNGVRVSYDFYPYTAWGSSIHRARFSGNWLERYKVDFSHVYIFGENHLTRDRFEELMADSADRNVIVDAIPRDTMDFFALHTTCPIGTDSEANLDATHPRGVGSFTKFINEYVDTGKVSFAAALYRFSTATAELFTPYIPGLAQRGAIKVGYAADLVLWDRSKIKSRADFEHPLEPSSGVVAAFVNGIPVISDSRPVSGVIKSGRHLKGLWAK